MDAAGPGRARWRKPLTVGLVVVSLAVAVPLVLTATRPTGTISLPLPPGLPTPSTGSGAPGTVVPLPPSSSGGSSGVGDPTAPGGGDGTPGGPVPVAPARAPAPVAAPVVSAPPPVPAPAAQPLTASYATVAHTGLLGLLGYRGQVTIINPGTVPVSGWTVTISLPTGETVNGATGAGYSQSGSTVTFTPAGGTGTVPGHRSVSFTFTVGGLLAGDPTGCSIDGRRCS